MEVVALLTTITEAYDRVSMHGVRTEVLRAQASALGLPLICVGIPATAGNGVYERRMRDVLLALRARGVRTVAFGDLFLGDVREYREHLLRQVEMGACFPLWGLPTGDLARRFIDSGYRAVLTCVDGDQIDTSFAGRLFDGSLLTELPDGADPCGENGEFHSFVYDGPIMTEPVLWRSGENVLREGRFMFHDVVPLTG